MTVSAKDQLALMARYHGWATKRLLASIEPMPEDAYRRPCGLFFQSVHGTLNHLLLTDSEIWYRLIAATARWREYVDGLSDAALAEDLRFTMTTGQARTLPKPAALLHVFNHATHHRGQITAAISMLGFEFQPLDLAQLIFAEQASSTAL